MVSWYMKRVEQKSRIEKLRRRLKTKLHLDLPTSFTCCPTFDPTYVMSSQSQHLVRGSNAACRTRGVGLIFIVAIRCNKDEKSTSVKEVETSFLREADYSSVVQYKG